MKAPTDFQTRPVQISIGVSVLVGRGGFEPKGTPESLYFQGIQDYVATV